MLVKDTEKSGESRKKIVILAEILGDTEFMPRRGKEYRCDEGHYYKGQRPPHLRVSLGEAARKDDL